MRKFNGGMYILRQVKSFRKEENCLIFNNKDVNAHSFG